MAQGRLAEAEDLALLALESYEHDGGPVAHMFEHLAVICERDGRRSDADHWRQLISEHSSEH